MAGQRKRPPLKRELRGQVLTVRFSERELTELVRQAEVQQVTVSELIRSRCGFGV